MDILLKEITLEKMRPSSELGYIQRIQQLSDKAKSPLTFKDFVSTGRIYPRDVYLQKYNKKKSDVHEDTQLVVVYMLGVKMDRLYNAQYYAEVDIKGNTSTYLDKHPKHIEQMLYEKVKHNISTKVAQANNI